MTTTTYAPAMMSCLLGEPSWELIHPPASNRPYQAHVRFGSHAATVEDPGWCRAVAEAFLSAANALDAAGYARARVAAQLAPVDAALVVVASEAYGASGDGIFSLDDLDRACDKARAAEREHIREHFAGLPDNTGRPQWACAQIELLGEPS